MTPTPLALNLAAGKARADRDRLIRLVLAVEAGGEHGEAEAAWRLLLRVAHWMAKRAEVTP